jgi:hypothetical protein
MDTFQEKVLFLIFEYSFESALLTQDEFSFEAGFGAENFGSKVTLPLLAISEIIVENRPILVNFFSPFKKTEPIKNSMEKLLQNPENQKFLKKKK